MNPTHQAASLAVEIRIDFFLECGLVEVPTANSNTQSHSLLFCVASYILVDSDGGVDTTSLAEEGADGSARAFGSDEDDIDVFRNVDLCEVLEDRREAVREVESLCSQ